MKSDKVIVLAGLAILLAVSLSTIKFANYEGTAENLWEDAHGYPLYFGSFPNLGHYGPIVCYIVKFFIILYDNPHSIFICIILLRIAACYLIYRFGKDFFNVYTGVIASLMFGFSGFNLQTQLIAWPHSFIPFFAVLFLYSVYKVKYQNSTIYYLPLFASLSVLIQLHISTLPAFLLMIIFFIQKPKIDIRHLLAGVLLFFVLFLPYIIYEAAGGFNETHNRLESLSKGDIIKTAGSSRISPAILFSEFKRAVFSDMQSPVLSNLILLIIGYFLISILILKKVLKKNKEHSLYLLLAFMVSYLFLGTFPIIYEVHFEFLMPFAMLIIASVLGALIKYMLGIKKVYAYAAVSALVLSIGLFIGFNLGSFIMSLDHVEQNHIPFSDKLRIAEVIAQQKMYGKIYTIGIQRLSSEGIDSLIYFYNPNIRFDDDSITLIMKQGSACGGVNGTIKTFGGIFSNYDIAASDKLIKGDLKFTQVYREGWYESQFDDGRWIPAALPLHICLGKNTFHGCSNYAGFASFYVRGNFGYSGIGDRCLLLQDAENTHELSGFYLNGKKMAVPPEDNNGDIKMNISSGLISGNNTIAIYLKLRPNVINEQARRMIYNVILI